MLLGKNFALNCSIPFDKKENPDFEWVLPNKNANKHTMLFNDNTYAISTLKIKNPTLSDSGNYTCIVKQGNSSVSDTKNIEVKKSIVPFVQFQIKDDTKQHIHFVTEGDNFKWVMYFKGYPKNLKYTFYNPHRISLLHKDKRVRTSYVYEDGKLSLRIKRVTAEDFGNYSVKLEAPNGSYDENYAILIVNDKGLKILSINYIFSFIAKVLELFM
ncbi:hypothetical protein Avbf_13013 [Armadillidium vulgare]|nr:hypothetical protein Avbf_13013 [Armadillidium vulgare]